MTNDTSRISLAIRKGVTYERLPQFENDINMSIWVRIKTGRRKWTYFCGCYRQWKAPEGTPGPSDNTKEDQKERFEALTKQIDTVVNLGKPVVVGGDLNIDRNVKNNPLKRGDVKIVTELLEAMMTRNKMYQLNWENTRHRINTPSSLLDLIITNIPTKIDSIATKANIISDHSLVSFQVHSKALTNHPQIEM